MQALFNKASASSRWKIEARTLKQSAEYFGPKTEQLDICYDQEQVTLTSYTEKVMHGKEVLKQPMQTAITIDTADFEEFSAPELVHIGISVKDFRNIVTHAESLKCSVTAIYSYPTKPLQFSYGSEGMSCEFTLMTIGDFGDSATPAMSRAGTREPQRQPAPQTSASGVLGSNASNSRSSRSARPLGSRPDTGSQHRVEEDQASEGLFVPGDEDEKQWDPAEPQDEDGEMLDWDASADHVCDEVHLSWNAKTERI
ncbi:MAG: hypothetical protein M1828_004369 [Chrysothrix sp. TS-e1954]|nr:MAG: hypothetical protein M1828_004369 [Chrysothrix sp. TS-e1954]